MTPLNAITHDVDLISYYNKAINLLDCMMPRAFFYVFSDDISFVLRNIALPSRHRIVSHNTGLNSYRDMELMGYCKHHIIANSTFSWWGAWFNTSPNKIVIAPHEWFTDQAMCSKITKDVYPRNSILI